MVTDLTSLSSSQATSTRGRVTEHSNTAARSTNDSGQPAASPSGDTVKLSSAAQSLQNVQSKLADTPDVDQNKVERLKAEIESGNYQVNAEKVAAGMMSFEDMLK
ncbi:flagellar biosynthesis anti-sigma factor FlgM [Marinobacterium jannaschii]|uniref:flagellar biosynthesis anti-sigma factor FlgM n=1 Tax=Marinobacterium jannaschii TaxID=64970 RepID=UPI0004835BDF|nr:flagellar biosynthesis anti-sigma factor FlgM [Marinobacterium jannaschii]